ncbi:dephospho-CoA kinase [Halofilum ochraceum]|uniref:dephospho-CoA kinase n=1 Tax=Halofilum ochraceum TaxID=1611323 RepID=UPI0008DABF3A|nr:dephospho-CoA kinase [Halofilum ochraceum]
MLRIGLTGGAASGKSLVARYFEALGARVIDADAVSREVVRPGTDGLAEVIEAFGEGILAADGSLDRRALRGRIFEDDAARHRLESILHPRIRAWMANASASLEQQGHPYLLCVIPLLIETDQASDYDRVVVVDAPAEVQRARLCRRDGMDAAAADAMLAAQAGRWRRLAAAHDVVANGDSVAPETGVACQMLALDRKFRLLSGIRI